VVSVVVEVSHLDSRFSDRALRTFSAKVMIVRVAAWMETEKAHPENVMAPLKLGYAVRLLEDRGHRVSLLDMETGKYTEEDIRQAFQSVRPEVVVLHGITTAVPVMKRLALYVRQRLPGTLVVASGQHATALPGEFIFDGSPFHAATQYEYEEPLGELVEAWSLGDLSLVGGLVLPDDDGGLLHTEPRLLREDLDTLPMPAHERFMTDEYTVFHPTDVRRKRRWGFLLSSRGCPYPCVYCSPTLRNTYGRKMRYRSAENVVDEMEYLVGLGTTVLHFKDDIFTISKDRVMTLCDEILRRGLRVSWTCQTRADCVDLALLKRMRKAGCCTVSYGVESGSARILEILRKQETVDDALNAARWTREAGLFLVTFYLLANPTETIEEMEMTLALAKKIDPDILQVGFFTPYPGSPYYEETFKFEQMPELELRPDEFSHYNKIINVSAVPTQQLMRFQRRFYRELIMRPGFVSRFLRNRLSGLPGNVQSEMKFLQLSARFLMKSIGNVKKSV
jgi:radical SAM superfamily enzyme YgiQ (UPF0313 family)